MAELTYSDIKEAIIEALEEHEQDNARYSNSDRRLRKENNRLTKDLLDTLKRGFKDRKSQDQDFLNKLTKKIQQNSGGRSFSNEDGSFGFGTKSEKKFGQFLDKSFSRLDKGMTKLSNNIYMKIATRWNAMSNEATQQIVNAMKSFNASGISQDWDKLSYSLRDSTITMEDFVKASKEHNTAFQILNKSTKNAAGTYQGLAKSAAEFATHQGKVAYDNEQLSEAINSYIESQRATGNLDKLNQKQMEDGVNRLLVSADKLAKEFGLNRDELIKNSQKEDKNVNYALMNSNLSPNDIDRIKYIISQLEMSNPELAKDLKNQIATFGTDANALSHAAYLGSSNLNRAQSLFARGRILEAAELYGSMETREQIANRAPTGAFAGILNMKGGEFGEITSDIAYRAKQNVQMKGASTETDKTLIWEQRYRNEQLKKSNNEIYLMAKAAAGARAEFATLTYSLQAVNAALSGAAWTKNQVNNAAPWISQGLGIAGGILTIVDGAASTITLMDSFRNGGGSIEDWMKKGHKTKYSKNAPKPKPKNTPKPKPKKTPKVPRGGGAGGFWKGLGKGLMTALLLEAIFDINSDHYDKMFERKPIAEEINETGYFTYGGHSYKVPDNVREWKDNETWWGGKWGTSYFSNGKGYVNRVSNWTQENIIQKADARNEQTYYEWISKFPGAAKELGFDSPWWGQDKNGDGWKDFSPERYEEFYKFLHSNEGKKFIRSNANLGESENSNEDLQQTMQNVVAELKNINSGINNIEKNTEEMKKSNY